MSFFQRSFNTAAEKSEGGLQLARVARDGDLEAAVKLLDRDAAMEEKLGGYTALHLAAAGGHTNIVKLLLRRGADIEAKGQLGETPLVRAVEQGKKETVALLLEKDADKNPVIGVYNETLLMRAVCLGHNDIVALLLKEKVSQQTRDSLGYTALTWALEKDNFEAARLLIKEFADLRGRDKNGRMPMIDMAAKGNIPMLELLVRHNAPFQDPQHPMDTALGTAIKYNQMHAFYRLIQLGAPLEDKNTAAETPLVIAVCAGRHEAAKILLQNGADIAATKISNQTLLIMAAERNDAKMIKLLLSKGANIDEQDNSGFTALTRAARNGKAEAVRVLLENGANTSLTGKSFSKTAMDYAIQEKHEDIQKMLHDIPAARQQRLAEQAARAAEERQTAEENERRIAAAADERKRELLKRQAARVKITLPGKL